MSKLTEISEETVTGRPAVRPPMNKKLPIKMLGAYGGILTYGNDFEKIGSDLYSGGYNAISAFLSTVWGSFPWVLRADGKFDFTKIDKKWKDNLYAFVETMAFWRVAPHLKFVDQFHDTGDSPGPDPFRQGLKLGNDWDDNLLYNSLTSDFKFVWISWEEPHSGKFTNFKPLTPFGHGMELFVDTVIDICKQVRDLKNAAGKPLYPDFAVSWAWANECLAWYDPKTNKQEAVRGDRDEIHSWIKDKWTAAGFIANTPKFHSYFDYLCYTKGKSKFDVDYAWLPSMIEQYNSAYKRHRACEEVHGIFTVPTLDRYVKAVNAGKKTGVPANAYFGSTDGDLRMEADYTGLGHSAFHTDLKLDAKKGQPFFPGDYMKFWNTYFPKYKTYIR